MMKTICLAIVAVVLITGLQVPKVGVVLLKNGDRIVGQIQVVENGVIVVNPQGLLGKQFIRKSEIRFCNPESTEIPPEVLGEGEWTPQDEERDLWQEEYERIEQELAPVIGITKQKLAKVKKKEDELLRKREFRSDALAFRARPPKGWRTDVQGNLVMFIGPTLGDLEPRIHVLSIRLPEEVPFEELVQLYRDDLNEFHGDAVKSTLELDIRETVEQKQWASSFTVDRGGFKTKTRRFLVKKGSRVFLLALYTEEKDDERNYEIFRYWKNTFVILI